jgi:hypothetical protein
MVLWKAGKTSLVWIRKVTIQTLNPTARQLASNWSRISRPNLVFYKMIRLIRSLMWNQSLAVGIPMQRDMHPVGLRMTSTGTTK